MTDLNKLDVKERQSGKHIMRHLSLASEAYNITLSVDGINAALYKEDVYFLWLLIPRCQLRQNDVLSAKSSDF